MNIITDENANENDGTKSDTVAAYYVGCHDCHNMKLHNKPFYLLHKFVMRGHVTVCTLGII